MEEESMAPQRTVQEQIHRFVVSNFLFDTGEVEDDASLTGEGVIDSTGVLELLMFVEETFGITVADEEVTPEHFDSVKGLASYVEGKQATDLAAVG